MKKTFSNDYATFWIEHGIVFFIYHPVVILDLRTAEKIVSDRLKFQEEKAYPVFCDSRGVTDTEKSARDFLAKEGSLLTTAVAFLVNPPISKAIIDFYIKTNQPVTPTKVFTDRSEALDFLRNFIKK